MSFVHFDHYCNVPQYFRIDTDFKITSLCIFQCDMYIDIFLVYDLKICLVSSCIKLVLYVVSQLQISGAISYTYVMFEFSSSFINVPPIFIGRFTNTNFRKFV